MPARSTRRRPGGTQGHEHRNRHRSEHKSSSGMLAFILIGAALLVGGGIAAYFAFAGTQQKATESEASSDLDPGQVVITALNVFDTQTPIAHGVMLEYYKEASRQMQSGLAEALKIADQLMRTKASKCN